MVGRFPRCLQASGHTHLTLKPIGKKTPCPAPILAVPPPAHWNSIEPFVQITYSSNCGACHASCEGPLTIAWPSETLESLDATLLHAAREFVRESVSVSSGASARASRKVKGRARGQAAR